MHNTFETFGHSLFGVIKTRETGDSKLVIKHIAKVQRCKKYIGFDLGEVIKTAIHLYVSNGGACTILVRFSN